MTELPRSTTGIPPLSFVAALAFVAVAMVAGYRTIGLPPLIIVGGSGLIGLVMWSRTYRFGPIEPDIILPPFLLTVAGLEVHLIEEYEARFGPAMSRVFNISWTEHGFLLVFAFVGPILYTLIALGLYRRVPLAGFMAWFIFIGPGTAELSHFIFPLLKPAIEPSTLATISQTVANGRWVEGMPNYYFGATGRYYFAGLYTAVLPMIPGIYGISRVVRAYRARAAQQLSPASTLRA